MVGASGFEPPTSRSRTVRSTKLSHAPTRTKYHTETRKQPGLQLDSGSVFQKFVGATLWGWPFGGARRPLHRCDVEIKLNHYLRSAHRPAHSPNGLGVIRRL